MHGSRKREGDPRSLFLGLVLALAISGCTDAPAGGAAPETTYTFQGLPTTAALLIAITPTIPGQEFDLELSFRFSPNSPDACLGAGLGGVFASAFVAEGGQILSSSSLPPAAHIERDLGGGRFVLQFRGNSENGDLLPGVLVFAPARGMDWAGSETTLRATSPEPFRLSQTGSAAVTCLTQPDMFPQGEYWMTPGLVEARNLAQPLASPDRRFLAINVASTIEHSAQILESGRVAWATRSEPPHGGFENSTFLLAPGDWHFEIPTLRSFRSATTALLSIEGPDLEPHFSRTAPDLAAPSS